VTSAHGLPVKMMIGSVTGWLDEGFTLTPEISCAGPTIPCP
jgi:hypothetical protein